MSLSFVEEIRRAGRYLLGSPIRPADRIYIPLAQENFAPQQDDDESAPTPHEDEVSRQNRRQATLTMAAILTSRVEKKDYTHAVSELMRLSPDERVAVAEKMVSINTQHRSIITSLPRVKFSYLVAQNGRKDVEFLQINDDAGLDVAKSKSFCFRQDYCFHWS